MINLYKVVIYLKDVVKPIIITCSENETEYIQLILDQIENVINGKSKYLKFDSGDMVLFPDGSNDIRSIFITKDK